MQHMRILQPQFFKETAGCVAFSSVKSSSELSWSKCKVKFEDVQSLECVGGCGPEWELVLNLKKPPSCYKKTNGSWATVESPAAIASAKTIRCVTRAPGVKDEVAWKCSNEVRTGATGVFFPRP